jgi:hypothetical protein
VSDLVEAINGGFSNAQLVLTFVAEAAIPFFVIGLYVVQRPAIGRLGLVRPERRKRNELDSMNWEPRRAVMPLA